MNNLLMFLCLLVLLLAPLRRAGQGFSDGFEALAKLHVDEMDVEDEQEQEQDDVLELLDLPSWDSDRTNKVLINVDGFGAVGDGVGDDTKVYTKKSCILFIYTNNLWISGLC